jgi:predicted nucleic acid-binding protein
MKAFFDTSVLVPVFYGEHIHHQPSIDLFIRFNRSDASCGAHSLAEVYSTLTRMPGRDRVSAEQAMLFVGSIRERLSVVALTGSEYVNALEIFSGRGIVGGAIYDALLARCAMKAKAETIYTWNLRHYEQCGAGVARLLRTPLRS